MTEKEFHSILQELFEVEGEMNPTLDLSEYIKDSIDLGELVAMIKMRHALEPKDWESFKTNSQFHEVYTNFVTND